MSDFEMDIDQEENLVQLTCPAGQAAQLDLQPSGKSYLIKFCEADCQACSFYQTGHCPAHKYKRKETFGSTCRKVVFSPVCASIASGLAKRKPEPYDQPPKQPSIKSSINSIMEKAASERIDRRVILCAALGANLRRIFRYEHDKQRGKDTSKKNKEVFSAPVFRF